MQYCVALQEEKILLSDPNAGNKNAIFSFKSLRWKFQKLSYGELKFKLEKN